MVEDLCPPFDKHTIQPTKIHTPLCELAGLDLVVELVVGSLYHIAAHTTTALGFLEMLLADWFVLKEQVCVSQRLLTDIALKLMCVGGEAEAQAGLPSYSPGGRRSCC